MPKAQPDKTPTVSVVVPVYNRPDRVAAIAQTLRRQTFADWEVVFVDDGSEAARRPSLGDLDKDPRFRLVVLPENRGPSAARNAGVRAAVGAYVAFLDSDDDWAPEKLARQVQAVQAHPDPACVFCVTQTQVIMPDGWVRVRPDFSPAPGQSFAEYLYCDGGFAQASALLLARELAMDHPFQETLRQYEDHLFYIALHAAGLHYLVIAEPLSVWRNDARPDRLSAHDDTARGDQFLAIAAPLLSKRAALAFQLRVQGPARLRAQPIKTARLAAQALLSRALSPKTLAMLTARLLIPQRLWRQIQKLAP